VTPPYPSPLAICNIAWMYKEELVTIISTNDGLLIINDTSVIKNITLTPTYQIATIVHSKALNKLIGIGWKYDKNSKNKIINFTIDDIKYLTYDATVQIVTIDVDTGNVTVLVDKLIIDNGIAVCNGAITEDQFPSGNDVGFHFNFLDYKQHTQIISYYVRENITIKNNFTNYGDLISLCGWAGTPYVLLLSAINNTYAQYIYNPLEKSIQLVGIFKYNYYSAYQGSYYFNPITLLSYSVMMDDDFNQHLGIMDINDGMSWSVALDKTITFGIWSITH
jgi:hypothetical protein